jgi:hypothetical protein
MEKRSEASKDHDRRNSSQKEDVTKTGCSSLGFWMVLFPRIDRVQLGFEFWTYSPISMSKSYVMLPI